MLDLLALAQECAPNVAPQTMAAIVSVESSKNPYAIGVVGGRLERQPKSHQEAVATAFREGYRRGSAAAKAAKPAPAKPAAPAKKK